ncbi:MAG: hypothetical protein NUV80_05015, partial [Candidatus Berkelbacteria bacterium]|nr:hypothetical protein [Candidatus Berkelbacteria bacterium]
EATDAAFTCSMSGALSCKNLSISFVGTTKIQFSGNQTNSLDIYGNLDMSGGTAQITWDITMPVSFLGAGITQTIKTYGVGFKSDNIILNGAGSTFQLLDNFQIGTDSQAQTLTLTAGTFDGNSCAVISKGFSFTIVPTVAITFYDLEMLPTTAAVGNFISLAGDITVSNTFTLSNGATATNRIFVKSSVLGTTRTITAAAISVANADFQDITGAGAASWDMSAATNGSGDCGGNTMKALGAAAFTSSTTQHWVNADGGSWSTVANWTSRVPLPQDNVVFDCAFNTAKVITGDLPRLCKNIDFTGATWTTSLSFTVTTAGITYLMFGSLTLINGLTWTSSSRQFQMHSRSAATITCNGAVINSNFKIDANGTTFTLGSDFFLNSVRSLLLVNGTLTAVNGGNNYVISAGKITVTATTGTLTLGSAIHLLIGTGTVFSGDGTITASTGTLKITDTSTTAIIFAGGGKVYNNIWFSRGASTANNTISGSNTFNDFKDTGTAAHSLIFTEATTQTVATWTMVGSSGNAITLTSTTATDFNLVKSGGGFVSSDWLNIQNCDATPAAITWFAGTNSVDNQAATDGTGWIFTRPTPPNMFLSM